MHVRKQIRDAFVTILNEIKTNQQFRNISIFTNPVSPIVKGSVPCIIVKTDNEIFEYESPTYPRLQKRTLEVHIECVVKIADGYEDLLDDLMLAIEDTLGKNDNLHKTLNGLILWKDIKEQSLDYQAYETSTGLGKIVLEVVYRTEEDNNSINI